MPHLKNELFHGNRFGEFILPFFIVYWLFGGIGSDFVSSTKNWVGQVVLYAKWVMSPKALLPQNKVWKHWTLVFLIFQFFMFMPVYLRFFGLDNMTSYLMAYSFVVTWLLLSSISLFFFPSLLYGKVNSQKADKPKLINKLEVPVADDLKSEEAMQTKEFKMDELLLFFSPDYSINDFSKDVNIPIYQISKSLNTFRGMGFVD